MIPTEHALRLRRIVERSARIAARPPPFTELCTRIIQPHKLLRRHRVWIHPILDGFVVEAFLYLLAFFAKDQIVAEDEECFVAFGE